MNADTPGAPIAWADDGVILYDGVCVFCSRWMRFVMARDTEQRFRFTAIQSPYGRALAAAVEIDPDDPDTNAVVIGGRVFRRSDAALVVLASLPRWRWVRVLSVFPRRLRDGLYDLVARNRYALFGKHQRCDLGDAAVRDRVLSDLPPGAQASRPLATPIPERPPS